MADSPASNMINICVAAHDGAGKTAFSEGIVRLARTSSGEKKNSTILDYEPEEAKRNFTVSTSATFAKIAGKTFNIIDTPGFQDFMEDTKRAMFCADTAILLASAISGVKHQTERFWDMISEIGLPTVAFVNKMDKERAGFLRAVDDLEKELSIKALPMVCPIGEGGNFKGVSGLLSQKAYIMEGEFGEKESGDGIGGGDFSSLREHLIEVLADFDDDLMENFLEGKEISEGHLKKVVKEAFLTRRIVPVFCGSAKRGSGIRILMDFLLETAPSPFDRKEVYCMKNGKEGLLDTSSKYFSAYVFKTSVDHFTGRLNYARIFSGSLKQDDMILNSNTGTEEKVGQIIKPDGKDVVYLTEAFSGDIVAFSRLKDTKTGDTLSGKESSVVIKGPMSAKPCISMAVKPKGKHDEEKIMASLGRLAEEDCNLHIHRDPETKDLLLSGMGMVHLEVAAEKLKRKFDVEIELSLPHVPYKETIRKKASAQGKYKKQSGGRGQYGDCHIEIEPLPRGFGFVFTDRIVGGVIPKQYIPAVEKGIIEAMEKGELAGFPVVDLKVTLYDGSFHTVDSSELAFKIAGSMAFKKAFMEAAPVLLEPVYKLSITVAPEFLGDIIGDLNAKRGKVLGATPKARGHLIEALVPFSEIERYSEELNSMTQGTGIFTMGLSHYDEVPTHLSKKIMEEVKA